MWKGLLSEVSKGMILSAIPVSIQDNHNRFSVHLTLYNLPCNVDLKEPPKNSAHIHDNLYMRCSCAHSFLNEANSRNRHNMSELLQRPTWVRWNRRWQNGEARENPVWATTWTNESCFLLWWNSLQSTSSSLLRVFPLCFRCFQKPP